MSLVLKLDLDIVKMYLYANKQGSIPVGYVPPTLYWTETPMDRDPTLDRDPQPLPWTQTPLNRDPLDRDPPTPDRDSM